MGKGEGGRGGERGEGEVRRGGGRGEGLLHYFLQVSLSPLPPFTKVMPLLNSHQLPTLSIQVAQTPFQKFAFTATLLLCQTSMSTCFHLGKETQRVFQTLPHLIPMIIQGIYAH